MCGIVGYVGGKNAQPFLINSLKKLEYRGYDSSGIAICANKEIHVARAKGKLQNLEKRLDEKTLEGHIGIGHTRWATHGKPSDENAHPHRSNHVVVVHNGIIENHLELREKLQKEGFVFQSETDTETVPAQIEYFLNQNQSFEVAVQNTLKELRGAFSFAILCTREPDKIIVAKNASPLILGLGEGEMYVASDIPALLEYTREVVVLEDGEMAIIEKDRWSVKNFLGSEIQKTPKTITWSRVAAEKDGFKHFMLKEIYEQPRAITDTLRGRIIETSSEVILDDTILPNTAFPSRVVLVACGTSWHAALVAKFWIEGLAKIPVEVDWASEFRYRKPVIDNTVLFIPISQSGETADTLAALEEAQSKQAYVLSICNSVDSSIARKSNSVVYTHAGPEIGVASTKAFTTQLVVLLMIALRLARKRKTISENEMKGHLHTLTMLPFLVEKALSVDDVTKTIAKAFLHTRDFLYLGRGSSFPIALEGALKLKEISYIHAEGYSAAEMKHGPIALIDEDMPVVVLATGGSMLPKIIGNLQEVKARGGKIIAVISEGDQEVSRLADYSMSIPKIDDLIRPIVETIPLQLLAYHFADLKGTDV
ncbi:MAG: glutamine--fructose-6-phosphate transaminase (isomerizing), partial [Bdellovibrionales bacterium]|nr:glutamine--fructose-6-phosphate transaminase (isomerizing) [Bdellovibrionales bacterium]